ncbi:MAG TPA: hypothetical protein VEP90_10040 [Methylomirabilota bacterium]|nr:hypothetical protein [Methylomirabilota bacterium]
MNDSIITVGMPINQKCSFRATRMIQTGSPTGSPNGTATSNLTATTK